MVYENLLEPQNVASGIGEIVQLAPKSFFSSIKNPTGPFTNLGDELIITDPHVLHAGRQWLRFQLSPQKNKLDYKTKGDLGSMGQIAESEIFLPGSYPQAHAMIKNLLNVPLIVLHPDASCESGLVYQLGCDCLGAYLVPDFTTSTTKDGTKGYLCKIQYDGGVLLYGPGTSNPAPALSISTQPTGGSLGPDVPKTFLTVASGGTAPYTYQWKKNGANIMGATSSSYTIASLVLADAGSYTCRVTDSVAATVDTAAAVLTVTAFAIVTQPVGGDVLPGGNFTLSVVLGGGTPPYTYRWIKDGADVPGATSASLTISNAQLADAGYYKCDVMDSVVTSSIMSDNVQFTVTPAAFAITTQPVGGTVAEGGAKSFTVAVTGGTPPYVYHWDKNTVSLGSTNSPTFTIPVVAPADAGTYRCRITDSTVLLTSADAILAVTALSFNTALSFVSATSDSDQGITGTTGASNANIGLQFNFVTPLTGTPMSMEIKKSGTTVMLVDFPSDYVGHQFRFTEQSGATHLGVFTNGVVNY